VFDASTFSERYIQNYIPINSYGWKICVDSVRSITINIGEQAGTTPVYTSGTNISYKVWNSVLDFLEFVDYDDNDFVYDNTTSNYKYLKLPARQKTYNDRSNYLYVLTKSAGDFQQLGITAFDTSGNILAQSFIANPYEASTTYTDKFLSIDLGKKGLDNIASGLVTGAYPILPANTSYYEVEDVGQGTITTITIECEPRFEVYTLHYLNKAGGFSTLHCNKVTELSSNKSVSTFKRTPWTLTSNVMAYNYDSAIENTQNVVVNDKLRVNSDWITEEENVFYKELFSSPVVYLDLGSSQGYASVKVDTSSFIVKDFNRKKQIQFDLSFTHSNHRQRK
jgi:hypothetical protein